MTRSRPGWKAGVRGILLLLLSTPLNGSADEVEDAFDILAELDSPAIASTKPAAPSDLRFGLTEGSGSLWGASVAFHLALSDVSQLELSASHTHTATGAMTSARAGGRLQATPRFEFGGGASYSLIASESRSFGPDLSAFFLSPGLLGPGLGNITTLGYGLQMQRNRVVRPSTGKIIRRQLLQNLISIATEQTLASWLRLGMQGEYGLYSGIIESWLERITEGAGTGGATQVLSNFPQSSWGGSVTVFPSSNVEISGSYTRSDLLLPGTRLETLGLGANFKLTKSLSLELGGRAISYQAGTETWTWSLDQGLCLEW